VEVGEMVEVVEAKATQGGAKNLRIETTGEMKIGQRGTEGGGRPSKRGGGRGGGERKL